MSRIWNWFLFLFFLTKSILCFSQREANIWYFGANAGLNFNTGSPISITNSNLSSDGGWASMSTPDGKLLFYTNGYVILDSTHTKMPNSKDERVNTNWETTQSALIVPLPDSAHIFYLFSNELILYNGFSTNLLHYSIINMNLNSGNGDVVNGKRRIPLLMFSSQRLTGSLHANGKDYWVISDKYVSSVGDSVKVCDSIYAWQLTSEGIKNPVISKSGFISHSAGQGYMKISPSGEKIAWTNYNSDTFCLGDFNALTGTVNNIWKVKLTFTVSLEFSRLSSYLYVCQPNRGIRKLYQYNAQAKTKTEFIQSRKLLDSAAVNGGFTMQLGPDGKIYVEEGRKGYLHVINAPDSAGVLCRFRKNAVYLSGKTTLFGLPNFIPVFLRKYIPAIDITPACAKDTTHFAIKDYNYPDSLRWDFGDPSSGSFNTSTKSTAVNHIYSKSGAYTVKVMLYYSGKTDSLKKNITIAGPKPNFEAMDVCENDSVHFSNTSEPKNKLVYKWKFGDGQTSSLDFPLHLYPISGISKTYNVTLVATLPGSCSDSITKAVTANANPISDFTYTANNNKIDFKAIQPGNTSYKWFLGNGDSASTKDVSYTFLKSGKYTSCLQVINAAGCFSRTCKDVLITVGINTCIKLNGFKLYPNPNTGNFTIAIENPAEVVSIEIYDAIGKLIHKVETFPNQKIYEIDLSGKSSPFNGFMVVRVNNGRVIWNQKVSVGGCTIR